MDSNKRQQYCDGLGLILIGLFSLGYVIFHKFFAEKHIQFPFLNFPIFVGEILLFACLLLCITKYWKNWQKFGNWRYVIMGYFVFVVGKTLYGYVNWGPLALRHAALFYYPVFAIFGYVFYKGKFLSRKIMFFLVLLIISIFAYGKFYGYYLLTLTFLGLILIKSTPHKGVKIILLLILFVFLPFREFFHTSRMMVVSNFVSGMYLTCLLPIIFVGKIKTKIIIGVIVSGIVLLGLFKFSDHNAVKSIFNFKQMVYSFYKLDAMVKINFNGLEMEPRESKLYNPERVEVRPGETGRQLTEEERAIIIAQTKKEIDKLYFNEQVHDEAQQFLSNRQLNEEVRQIVSNLKMSEEVRLIVIKQTIIGMGKIYAEQLKMGRDKEFMKQIKEGGVGRELLKRMIVENMKNIADGDNILAKLNEVPKNYNGNAVFRILIWRDMIVELINEKPVIGFDFGKPLRSRSLELLLFGYGDWSRDGWIGAHNSHLHIIYRAGAIGVMFLISLLVLLFRMIKKFVTIKSLTGILLCGILINWFVAANFLLTLELPYTAIPIWTLFGLTYAYCYKDEA